MKSLELFNTGDLDAAIQAATDVVRSKPTEIDARLVLAELYCFQKQWEKADRQLETVIMQDPQSALLGSVLRQLIRAETARQECFHQGRVPEFLGTPDATCETQLKILMALREGSRDAAAELLEELEQHVPEIRGTCNDTPFTGIRDLDDSCCTFFEVLTSTGKYYWVPFHQVESVEFTAPQRPRDLLWREAHMIVRDGPDGVVFVPTLYALTGADANTELRMARATDWVGEEGSLITGVGQRIFAVGDAELPIMELATMTFES